MKFLNLLMNEGFLVYRQLARCSLSLPANLHFTNKQCLRDKVFFILTYLSVIPILSQRPKDKEICVRRQSQLLPGVYSAPPPFPVILPRFC